MLKPNNFHYISQELYRLLKYDHRRTQLLLLNIDFESKIEVIVNSIIVYGHSFFQV